MAVIKNRHNSKNNFVQLDNRTLWNEGISCKAVGLWARCISRPPDWEFHINEVISKCKEGERAIYSAIKELIEHKLCIRVQYRWTLWQSDGKAHPGAGPIEYIFLEIPATDEEKQAIEKELHEEWENKLKNEGIEFYEAQKPKEFKKNFLHCKNVDPRSVDPRNADLLINKEKNMDKKEKTDDVSCSQMFTKDPQKLKAMRTTLPQFGVQQPQISKLISAYGVLELENAFEFMKTQTTPVQNAFGWLKKCLEEKWHEQKKKSADEKAEMLEKRKKVTHCLESETRGKLGISRIEAGKNEIFFFLGQKTVCVDFIDPKWNEKLEIQLTKMNLGDIYARILERIGKEPICAAK